MKATTIHVERSTGRILCCTIFRAGDKKLLAKGHVISEQDALMLETEGMNEVWVTELKDGEVGENDAVAGRERNWMWSARNPSRAGGRRICLPPKVAVF
jgi:hypothetical protein